MWITSSRRRSPARSPQRHPLPAAVICPPIGPSPSRSPPHRSTVIWPAPISPHSTPRSRRPAPSTPRLLSRAVGTYPRTALWPSPKPQPRWTDIWLPRTSPRSITSKPHWASLPKMRPARMPPRDMPAWTPPPSWPDRSKLTATLPTPRVRVVTPGSAPSPTPLPLWGPNGGNPQSLMASQSSRQHLNGSLRGSIPSDHLLHCHLQPVRDGRHLPLIRCSGRGIG